jgi:hypothetical protein
MSAGSSPRNRWPSVSGERSVSTSWTWSRPAPGGIRLHTRERMIGRGHRDHRHRARRHAFDPLDPGGERAAMPTHGFLRRAPARDRAQRLDMEPQRHGREFGANSAQHLAQPRGGQHHVDRQIHLGLEPVEQALHLGAQPVDALRDGRAPRPARRARRPSAWVCACPRDRTEHAQLRLEIADAVADHRHRAVQPPPGGGEAAVSTIARNRRSWSKVGIPGSDDISTSSNVPDDFIHLIRHVECR